ncbi:MAG TPA: hypothetical protein EYM84_05265 [Flavobacteriales bacterium]|nr:hypothetical protein [Flavobacteriales bacterium]
MRRPITISLLMIAGIVGFTETNAQTTPQTTPNQDKGNTNQDQLNYPIEKIELAPVQKNAGQSTTQGEIQEVSPTNPGKTNNPNGGFTNKKRAEYKIPKHEINKGIPKSQ